MPEVYRVLRCVNFKNRKRISGKIVLALCNILPIFTAAVFTIWYSGTVCSSQEQMMQNNFCNTVSIYQSCAALQSFVAFCAASARQTHSDLRKPPCTKPFTAVQGGLFCYLLRSRLRSVFSRSAISSGFAICASMPASRQF